MSGSSLGLRRAPSSFSQPPASPGTPTSRLSSSDAAMRSLFAKTNTHTHYALARPWTIVGVVVGIIALYFVLSAVLGDASSPSSTPHMRVGLRDAYRIAVIADLDKLSKRSRDGKEAWRSMYMTGTLRRDGEAFSVTWDPPADVITSHNEAGRGCELSELVRWTGRWGGSSSTAYTTRLMTFDDRTGIMFEVMNSADSGAQGDAAPYLAPRTLFMEGEGDTDKGLKVEWATIKGGHMYVGSFGKEFTNNAGEIEHANNLWVVEMDEDGRHRNIDWTPYYNAMRNALGYPHPSYLLHEAVVWSPVRKQWFVLPRRMSKDAYNEEEDERRGANTIIVADEEFKNIQSFTVGPLSPLRGFSSAKFLPHTRDKYIIALKSEENSELKRQTTYITMYAEDESGKWRVVMDEEELPHSAKFEGLEILS